MLQLSSFDRVLVLGAHPDDGEFGCGATMAKLAAAGVDVHYAMFSPCVESLPEGLPRDVLAGEAREASLALGMKPENLVFFDFPVRKFPQFRQEILEEMVRMRKELRPDLVMLPSTHDLHQDHATIAAEGWRAFKSVSLVGYEVAWNNLSFTAHLFSVLKPEYVEQKIEALRAYRSQEFRSYSKASFIRSLAEVRGTQVGQPLAEAFEMIRWIAH
jgi:LmbE family N-acetylglucosaminyl deacetylase